MMNKTDSLIRVINDTTQTTHDQFAALVILTTVALIIGTIILWSGLKERKS